MSEDESSYNYSYSYSRDVSASYDYSAYSDDASESAGADDKVDTSALWQPVAAADAQFPPLNITKREKAAAQAPRSVAARSPAGDDELDGMRMLVNRASRSQFLFNGHL